MTEKDKYFGLELSLSFCLLSFCLLMFGQALSALRPYLIGGLICGFSTGWIRRNSPLPFTVTAVNAAVLLIFIWIIYSLINSSLFYREVIVIYAKGILIMGLILSFGSCLASYLSYIQVLSIPVFMGSFLFAKAPGITFILSACGYIICWLAVLKIKLYTAVDIRARKDLKPYRYASPATALFLLSALLAAALFYNFTFERQGKKGLFPEEDSFGQEESIGKLEKEYYDLEDKINRKITKVIPELKLTQERQELIALFGKLMNESLDTLEVNKAEDGLISYLRSPGPGLEKKDAEELLILTEAYLDKKIVLNLKRIKDQILYSLRRDAFGLKEKFSGLGLANKMRYSKAQAELRKFNKEAGQMLDNSRAGNEAKSRLKELLEHLRDWKSFELYRKESQGSDFSGYKPQEFKQQLQALESKEEEEPAAQPGSRINRVQQAAGPALPLLVNIFLKTILFLVLILVIALSIFFFLSEDKKQGLRDLLDNSPRQFIVALYGNLKKVMVIFGLANKENLPPLSYANLIESRFCREGNALLKLTVKFEEAKYSGHTLDSGYAGQALKDYNNFLKALFKHYNKFSLFYKYCLALTERVHFKIL